MTMFLGKWNRSVLITYLGIAFAAAGILLCFNGMGNYAVCCLIAAGVCDLFDGVYARRCKRTDDEKEFGIQLDSLADVMDFIALPIAVFIGAGLSHPLYIALYAFFAVCGVARLAYFNISTAVTEGAAESYTGLPVTYTALIVPFVMLLKYIIPDVIFMIVFAICIGLIAIFNILKIKVKKPRGAAYAVFFVLALGMLVLYAVVL